MIIPGSGGNREPVNIYWRMNDSRRPAITSPDPFLNTSGIGDKTIDALRTIKVPFAKQGKHRLGTFSYQGITNLSIQVQIRIPKESWWRMTVANSFARI